MSKVYSFIGIGMTRSGSTWLWDQLATHPQVCRSPKEVYWFDKAWRYGGKFKEANEIYPYCGKNKILGEFSPNYFQTPGMAIKIKKELPNVKLLLILRNPIDRIWSQYKAFKFSYPKKAKKLLGWFFNRRQQYVHPPRNPATFVSFRDSCLYHNYLPSWQEVFGDNLKVTFYDDLAKKPLSYLENVFRFLGIKKNFVPPRYDEYVKKHYNLYYEKHPIKMTKEERRILQDHLCDSISSLEDMLEVDLSEWK